MPLIIEHKQAIDILVGQLGHDHLQCVVVVNNARQDICCKKELLKQVIKICDLKSVFCVYTWHFAPISTAQQISHCLMQRQPNAGPNDTTNVTLGHYRDHSTGGIHERDSTIACVCD
jgi:hypothetical protein